MLTQQWVLSDVVPKHISSMFIKEIKTNVESFEVKLLPDDWLRVQYLDVSTCYWNKETAVLVSEERDPCLLTLSEIECERKSISPLITLFVCLDKHQMELNWSLIPQTFHASWNSICHHSGITWTEYVSAVYHFIKKPYYSAHWFIVQYLASICILYGKKIVHCLFLAPAYL